MESVRLLKSRFSSAIIAGVMFLSFLFGGERLGGQIAAFLLGIVASIGLAEFLSQELASIRRVRRYFSRPYFIEGHWRIKTVISDTSAGSQQKKSVSLTNNGIMLIKYNPKDDDYAVTVTRLGNGGQVFVTTSAYCQMIRVKNTVKYLNYFEIKDGNHMSMCICDGEFSKRHEETDCVDFFSSKVFVEGVKALEQRATPLLEDDIKRFQGDGGDWQIRLLHDWNINPEIHEVTLRDTEADDFPAH
jgi:hypothetical protein